jgi:hypothetical protein
MLVAVALTSAWTGIAAAGELETLQAEWWQWAMAIPASHSPIFDKTGNRCGIAQRGDVWFLAGSAGAQSFCVTDTDDFIESFQLGTAQLTVDGTPLTISDVRDETDFNFAVDANGIFGAKPGIHRATIARGLWGIVGPLAPGAHTVSIEAAGPLFALSVTYRLTVVSPTN